MDPLQQWNRAVQAIEANLAGDGDCAQAALSQAARLACVSPDSFRRIFSYLTGMPLAEYIRRRKLTLAAEDLRQGCRVLDTALKYGFHSADAFSRAFTRQHGIAPAAFRRQPGLLRIVPPASFHIKIKGAKEMTFQIADVPEIAVYGFSKEFDPELYPSREALRYVMWDEKSEEEVPSRLCQGHWNELGNKAYDGLWYGIWQRDRYLIGREKELISAAGTEEWTIPAGKYAVFISEKGGYAGDEIPKLFETAFDAWLPGSGYRLKSQDVIEVYHLWTDKATRKEHRYYEVWVPVLQP